MSRSFYYGTESHLADAAMVFARHLGEDPARFGLNEEQCADYAVLAARYRAAYLTHAAPETRTTATRWAKLDAKRELIRASAALAHIVDAQPSTSDPVRVQLGLAIAQPRTPGDAPAAPGDFSIELSPIGTLLLKWKCPHAQRGTMYVVSRSVAEGPFEYLGIVGERRFTDATIPAGATAITYKVQGVRLKQTGAPAMFVVNFGSNGKSLPSSITPRIAA